MRVSLEEVGEIWNRCKLLTTINIGVDFVDLQRVIELVCEILFTNKILMLGIIVARNLD